ncbi:type VII secretion protein EccCa [Mycolicibacterium arenosum]|uniref:Type VII secretion protein EccCa n=1 Tax=Mycolicibacterium arenosum TaxID=2952157 RepID=A0ABT1MAQ4_9MYCO|nr:type VII secretion protein EccCa [Mycolicibacterium sp. CAU 1645]MCP9275477.1 type VII secretion protein EccCa [Mycolicibacterium sp. CAU 1645]
MEFVRAPRQPAPPVDGGVVLLDAPPEVPAATPAGSIGRLLPIAMVVAALGMTALYFTSGVGTSRSPMFALFPIMMVMSAVGSLAYGLRNDNRSAELDAGRRRYLRYLDDVAAKALETATAQHRRARFSHPDPAALWALVGGPRMWERGPGDPDFGVVRIGIGRQPLATPVLAPELSTHDVPDPVTADALRRLLEDTAEVADMPVTVDLAADPVIAVAGERETARALVRSVVCQLAVFHGPASLAISAVVDRASAGEWDWLKWLPQHRRPGWGDCAGEARRTFNRVSSVAAEAVPRTVVVVDSGSVTGLDASVDGVTVIMIGGTSGHVVDPTAQGADAMTIAQALACARRLARYREPSANPGARPAWTALSGIGVPDRVDPAHAWRPRVGRELLRVPVGTDARGDPVHLDLKEAADQGMGPHGLCVGATGSGKSEFLRTLTLSLVATHPPEALNLVLVDFKGGATFLGFERLHHVAAVITNLADEAHLVSRMRDALTGELTRRQELLRAAGRCADLAGYRAQRLSNPALPILPTLLIVVDEFSELLTAHPDFVDLFVAVGRVGRSLGIHLLLASQRLEEGRLRGLDTHLSYRICLKTFSASDSRAVLGTADAFDLPNSPGAALLKTPSGELIGFHAAYVSGAIEAASANPACAPGTVSPFTAAPVGEVRPTVVPREPRRRTVLDAVVARLADHGTPAHRVWLPPLVAPPTLAGVLAHATGTPELVAAIGLVDNAFAQRRDPLLADVRAAGGHVAVVGGPRSGKSTALRTLMLALAVAHPPDQVRFHVLDFGGELASVRELPHVGSVAGRFDRELAERIVAHVQAIVRRREAARERDGEVFLVIDGWGALRQEFDGIEETVTAIAGQGLSVGVHVVIAAARWAEIRPALKDRIGTRVELRLGDPADSEMDRRAARLLVDRPAGHGVTRDGLEAVIALPRLDGVGSAAGLEDAWRAAADTLRRRYPGAATAEVELLPAQVLLESVATRCPDAVVLGLDVELSPVVLDFATAPHALIVGDSRSGKTAALRTLCRELIRIRDPAAAQLVVVDVRRSLLGEVEGDHLRGYAMSVSGAESQLADVTDELRLRLPPDTVTQRQLRDRSWWSGPEWYVVVDDYDVVAASTVNPLTPLLEFLPHATDIGLHLVVARRSGGAARAMFDPVLSGLRDHGCLGLALSAGPDDGVLFGSVRPRPLPPGRGTVCVRGEPDRLLQVAWTDPR